MTEQQLIEKTLSIAKKLADDNYREGPNNDTIFGKWYGLNHQPWCAMFVSYCFNQAGAGKLVAAQTAKGFASCNAGYQWFKKKGQTVPIQDAQPGDIVFFNFDENGKTTEHVGIVYAPQPKKLWIITLEGNTSGDAHGSQANGDGVFKKTRTYKSIMGVARPNWKSIAKA